MDWSAWPMNENVFWPKDEGIIGVLGVAPIATADFYTKLVSRPTKKDWEHIRVLIDSNPKIPSRGRYFALGETDPVPFIQDGIKKLAENGASMVVVPCNTAHLLYDRFAVGSSVPIPNIIEVTANAAAEKLCKKPLLLASGWVAESGLYGKALERHNIPLVNFPNQKLITDGIEAVKQSADKAAIAKEIKKIILQISGIDSIILGCTELALLLDGGQGLPIQTLDSNQALADFCVDYVLSRS